MLGWGGILSQSPRETVSDSEYHTQALAAQQRPEAGNDPDVARRLGELAAKHERIARRLGRLAAQR